MGIRREPGRLEQEVLGILALAPHPLTPGEVRGRLDRDLAYTTVMTVLSRLAEKGVAARESQGRGYAYSAVTDPAAQVAAAMHRAMDGNDHEAVLQRFVRSLSPADEQLLNRLLKES